MPTGNGPGNGYFRHRADILQPKQEWSVGTTFIVGGATVAFDTPDLDMLEGRSDLAVLWDIRVVPAIRRQGVGAALFDAVEEWALARGCRQLKVETQNINVGACMFYARRGCVLRAAHCGVYAECPDEVQLLWYKDLTQHVVTG